MKAWVASNCRKTESSITFSILNPANRREKNNQDERRRSVSSEARKERGVWREVRLELRREERQEVFGEEKDARKVEHRGEC